MHLPVYTPPPQLKQNYLLSSQHLIYLSIKLCLKTRYTSIKCFHI